MGRGDGEATLVCVNEASEIPAALEVCGAARNAVVVAMSPHVEYELTRRGLVCRRPEDYYDERDFEQLGYAETRRLDALVAELDGCVQMGAPVGAASTLTPAAYSWYNFKLLMNSVAVHLFISEKMVEIEGPREVVCLESARETPSANLYYKRESLWPQVLPLSCRKRGIRCRVLPPVRRAEPALLQRVRDIPAYRYVRRCYRWARAWSPSRCVARVDGQVVFLGLGYSLGALARELQSDGAFEVVVWRVADGEPPAPVGRAPSSRRLRIPRATEAQFRAEAARLWAAAPIERLARMCQFDGTNFFGIILPRLRTFFLEVVPDCRIVYEQALRFFEDVRPVAVVAATMGEHRHQVVAHAARSSGVPVVVYKHGSSGGYVWMEGGEDARQFSRVSYQNDIASADVHLVNGEGDREYFEKYYPGPAKTIAVGSAHLDELRRRSRLGRANALFRRSDLDPGRPVVMYVPMLMDGVVRSIPYNHRSPGRVFAMERALVALFREFPTIQFVIKVLPQAVRSLSPIVDVVRDERIGNCQVLTAPLGELVPLADAFIFDFPSTIFLEALTTDRPVFLCGHLMPWKWARGVWDPATLEMWRERVVYADDLAEFLAILRRQFETGRFGRIQSRDILLRLFGTHIDDGRSAMRAREVVKSLRNGVSGYTARYSIER